MHIAWKYLKYKAMEENKSILSPRKSLFYDNVCLSPKEQIDLHRQSFWELTFIVLGSGIRLIGDTSEFFQAEEVIMIPPGIPHCWYFDCNDTGNDGKIHNITVTFSDTFLNNCQSSFPELSLSVSKLKNIHEAVKYNKPTTTLIVSILKEMKNQDDVEQLSSMIKLLPLLASTTTIQTVGKYQKKYIDTFFKCQYTLLIIYDYFRIFLTESPVPDIPVLLRSLSISGLPLLPSG